MPYRSITIRFQALCTSLLGVLFSVRSPYYFAIGLKEYLVLEVGAPPGFPHDIRRTVLRDMFPSSGLHLRDCHTLWSAVPGKFGFAARLLNSPTTPHFPEGIRFELCRFHSPLLTASRLISFPAPTEMFQFGAFPIMTDHYGEVPFGDPGFIGSMHLPPRLIAAWHVLRQLLSRAIHLIA